MHFSHNSKSNSSSGAKNCHWNQKNTTPEKKAASANPAHKNQWKTARFFWPFFQLNPAPPTGFSKHFTVHRVVSPFPSFRHEAAVGECCFGGVKGVTSTHPKRCLKGWFLSNLSLFFLSDVLTKRGPTKTGFVYKVVKSEQLAWPTKFLKCGDWWEIINWQKKPLDCNPYGILGVLAKKVGLVA